MKMKCNDITFIKKKCNDIKCMKPLYGSGLKPKVSFKKQC